MKNMSAWAIRHPVTPVVLFVVLFFMGVVAFIRLPINQNPDISFPYVIVAVSQPGAAPPEIETQIITKVEGAVASIGGVKSIQSTAMEGSAQIGIEFQIGTPVDRAVTDVRDAVSKVRADLPDGILEPTVTRLDIDGGAMVYYAVSTTAMTEEELSWFVDNTVTKRLLGTSGVAQITRGGGVNREIRIELDPGRMQALGITAVEVNAQLAHAQPRRARRSCAGGRRRAGRFACSVARTTAAQLADTNIILQGGRIARLSDIAEVRDSVAEIRGLSKLNGRPATNFGVFRSKGSSDVTVSNDVEAEIAKIRRRLPAGAVRQGVTTVDNTVLQFDSAMITLIEGSILAVLVVYLFLRDWRATAISALAIPLSAIPTFAFMYWMDFTLNGVSLLALAGGGRAGRRRHRRDREHRAPHAHGQRAASGRVRRGGRDRLGGRRHFRNDHRGVPAGELHVRHRGPVLQAVRPHRCGGRVLLAARRATITPVIAAYTARRQPAPSHRWADHDVYERAREIGEASLADDRRRHRLLRAVDRRA